LIFSSTFPGGRIAFNKAKSGKASKNIYLLTSSVFFGLSVLLSAGTKETLAMDSS